MKQRDYFILWIIVTIVNFQYANAQNSDCLIDQITEELFQKDTVLRNNAISEYNRLLELERSGFPKMNPLNERVIPIVFHIIHQCGYEQVDDQQVINAVDDINLDFSANNIELSRYVQELDTLGIYPANSGLQFKLATIDPDGYPTTGITRTQYYATYNGINMETDLKRLIQWNPDKYLNVWVVKSIGGTASAYAHFPSTVDGKSSRYLDGIVINHSYLGTTGTAEFQFFRRHILTHEIGHWAGLRHCWSDDNRVGNTSNCSKDDQICDTGNTVGDSRIIYPIDTIIWGGLYRGVDNIFDPIMDTISGFPINFNDQNTNGNGILEPSDLPIFCTNNTDDDPCEQYAPLFNYMDYGAEFHFTQGQADRMTMILNDPVAARDQIGLAADMHQYFIADTNNLATITTDGLYLMEDDLNDGSFLNDGIEIQLSSGTFNFDTLSTDSLTDFSVLGLPDGTTLEILRNEEDSSKATVNILGNALNHNIDDNNDVIITFEPDNFLLDTLSLYNNSIRLKTFFLKDKFVEYSVYDESQIYNFSHNYCSSIRGLDSMYAPFYVNRVGYLAIEYFNDTLVRDGDTIILPSGFYLVNESDRQVEAVCLDSTNYSKEIAHLSEGQALHKIDTAGYKYEKLSRSPRFLDFDNNTKGLLILEDDQVFDEDKPIFIGIKISSDCNNNEMLGWIRVKIFADGKTIEILDGVVNYNPIIDSMLIENPPCIPSSETNIHMWIEAFELLDRNGEGLINVSGGTNDTGYSDYSDLFADTSLASMTIMMNKNDCYDAKITRADNYNSAFFYIWIDFDDDLLFEVDEKVLSERDFYGNDLNTSLCLPENATYGAHKMRVAASVHPASVSSTGESESSINPCGNVYSGEFEDYTIYIYEGCEASTNFSNETPSGETQVASFIICSDSMLVENQEILLRAGDSIILNTGFDANADDNIDFIAEIYYCEIPETRCLEADSLELVTLYNATDGQNWTNIWDLTQPVNTWHGVTLSDTGCEVKELYLANNNLVGYIPPSISTLTSLEILNLAKNELSGAIPNDIGSLVNLQILDLINNDLNNDIPSEIGNLDQLKVLHLSGNSLTGQIPFELGNMTSLQILSVFGNDLSGEIPSELGNLSNLVRLYLNDNDLSGCYPTSLCDLPNLDRFDFRDNINLPDGGSDQGYIYFCAGDSPCNNNKLDLNSEINDKLFNVSVYPNPVHTSIIFDINLSKEVNEVQVKIVNTQGTEIESFTVDKLSIGSNSFEHSLKNLKPGVYNYIISANFEKITGKFIKIN